MKYKAGQIIPVYTDYQRQLGFEGRAELLEYKGKGLPFILDDTGEPHTTYSFEIWRVRLGNFTCIRKLRYKIRRGKAVRNEESYNIAKITDKFLDVNGKQIY